jgi:hypothetical protein
MGFCIFIFIFILAVTCTLDFLYPSHRHGVRVCSSGDKSRRYSAGIVLESRPSHLQEFCRTCQARLLQRCPVSPHNFCESKKPFAGAGLEGSTLTSPEFKDFMIQGGDPTGTGRGGTSIYGPKLYVCYASPAVVVTF